VTRGQLSKIVANAAGLGQPAPDSPTFEDVPSGSPFYIYIERVYARGVISGYPCGGAGEPCGPDSKPYFRPSANATRGQIAKIVSNSAGMKDIPDHQMFEDVPADNAFYMYTARLAMHGMMSGYRCGGPGEPCGPTNMHYFRPYNNATRGQVSKMVANTFFPNCQVR